MLAELRAPEKALAARLTAVGLAPVVHAIDVLLERIAVVEGRRADGTDKHLRGQREHILHIFTTSLQHATTNSSTETGDYNRSFIHNLCDIIYNKQLMQFYRRKKDEK